MAYVVMTTLDGNPVFVSEDHVLHATYTMHLDKAAKFQNRLDAVKSAAREEYHNIASWMVVPLTWVAHMESPALD